MIEESYSLISYKQKQDAFRDTLLLVEKSILINKTYAVRQHN